MDVPKKKKNAKAKKLRLVAYVAAAAVALSAITIALARLEPASPSVSRSTIWIGNVDRGPMLRQVRGTGTLVPEEVRIIPAEAEGQVEQILAKPGEVVTPSTVLVVLTNPEVDAAVRDAQFQLVAAEAELTRVHAQLRSQLMSQEAEAARVKSEYEQARLRADTDEDLAKKGLIAPLNQKLSSVTAAELENRNRIEQARLRIAAESIEAQLASQRAVIAQLRSTVDLRRRQLAGLRVEAGIAGVLQQLPVEIGQRVAPGALLARVAEPGKLKAELRIAETQAKDIVVGQRAVVDTRNGTVEGTVVRIDPAVQQGTVTVDVAFDGNLPDGARPDLTVDGTIEIERLDDVVFVGRPVNGQQHSKVGLFKLVEDGKYAVRTTVSLGRSSVNTIEVVDGLLPGDQVILSDMAAWDGYDRIEIE